MNNNSDNSNNINKIEDKKLEDIIDCFEHNINSHRSLYTKFYPIYLQQY